MLRPRDQLQPNVHPSNSQRLWVSASAGSAQRLSVVSQLQGPGVSHRTQRPSEWHISPCLGSASECTNWLSSLAIICNPISKWPRMIQNESRFRVQLAARVKSTPQFTPRGCKGCPFHTTRPCKLLHNNIKDSCNRNSP